MKEKLTRSPHGQAMPAGTVPVTEKAFAPSDKTSIIWLGGAGILINCRGTVLMIDPVLEGFDMPLLFDPPLAPEEVHKLDGLLITHIDNDHFSRQTCRKLACCKTLYAPVYVAGEASREGIYSVGKRIGDCFRVGPVQITLTPAWHNWQAEVPEFSYREWKREDYCGYRLETPDGSIWLPGDSRLLPEHLTQKAPDVILFDFSDNDWHITFDGAVQLANAYPNAKLICIHWGSVDAPEMTPFNGDPERLLEKVVNPERVTVLLPGEEYWMTK